MRFALCFSAMLSLCTAIDLTETFLKPGQSMMDLTGFEARTLQHVWDKYSAFGGSAPGTFGGRLNPIQRGGPRRRAFHFLCLFVYIHKCPQSNWDESFNMGGFTMSKHHWQPMHDVADALAQIIDEIVYDDRLHRYNHVGRPFKYHVTAIVDTLPVYIPEPHSFAMRRLLFQPKYGACVWKMQLGITLMGNIVLWTGPHLGVTSDVSIWRQTAQWHPFRPWEWWLGDLGYVGALGLLYKYKRRTRARGQPPPPPLTRAQKYYNNVHEFYRNRVEQIVDVIKSHRLFVKGAYRGSYAHLEPLLTIVGHVTAYELRMSQRFTTYGPWAHTY